MGQGSFETTIDLPSKGLLPGSREKLQLKSMTVREEKILFGKAGEGGEKLLQIIADCSDADEGAVRDFPFSDAIYAFVRLRNISVGDSQYAFRTACPVCQTSFEVRVDLDKQEVAFLDPKNASEPFGIDLPRSKTKILMRFKRLRDQIELDRMVKFRKQKGFRVDRGFISEGFANITDAIGDSKGKDCDFATKIKFFDSLALQDLNYLNEELDGRDFGISMRALGDCPECGNQDDFVIRLDASFFRSVRGAGTGAP
jgi:hypothetical protein